MDCGRYKYLEYDELGYKKKEIISKPTYKLLCSEYNNNFIIKNVYDSMKNEINKKLNLEIKWQRIQVVLYLKLIHVIH
jgi:hypothetical protein